MLRRPWLALSLLAAGCGAIPRTPCTHCPNVAGAYVQDTFVWLPSGLTCITTPPGYPYPLTAIVTQQDSQLSIQTGLSPTPLTGTLYSDLSVGLNTVEISSLLQGVAQGPLSLTGSFKSGATQAVTFSGKYAFTADSSCSDIGTADWTRN